MELHLQTMSYKKFLIYFAGILYGLGQVFNPKQYLTVNKYSKEDKTLKHRFAIFSSVFHPMKLISADSRLDLSKTYIWFPGPRFKKVIVRPLWQQ